MTRSSIKGKSLIIALNYMTSINIIEKRDNTLFSIEVNYPTTECTILLT